MYQQFLVKLPSIKFHGNLFSHSLSVSPHSIVTQKNNIDVLIFFQLNGILPVFKYKLITLMFLPDERHIERESRLLEPAVSTERPTTQTPPPMLVHARKTDCPMEGGTGLAPHPTDCSKFLNCWKGTAHTQQCGPGTLFNPQILQCDFPYRVNCIVSPSGSQGELFQMEKNLYFYTSLNLWS
jgi:hypothetical protein